jgi:hypothetical protein
MQECDKWNSHITSKLNLICVSSNNDRHPVTKIFTPIHYTSPTPLYFTCRHFTSSHLNFPQLHFTTLSFGLTLPLHFTSHHYTSLPFTFRRFSPYFYSFRFTPFIIAFLTLFLKILSLQGKVPNASIGSWFRFLWSYLQKNTSRYPLFATCP